MRVNSRGNICRHYSERDWFLVKHNGDRPGGNIFIGNITVPAKFVGKKIKLKIMVMK